MLTLQGKNNTATVYTDTIDAKAISQVIGMLNEPITKNTTVAIMPDVHAGSGSTIGTTIKLPENKNLWKICPNIIGVDIGCSMRAIQIKDNNPDLEKLDKIVNDKVPAGCSIHERPSISRREIAKLLNRLSFKLDNSTFDKILKSCGTLGSGNHYIELGKTPNNNYWLTVHTGSRALGLLVARHHQNKAKKYHSEQSQAVTNAIIEYLTLNNRQKEIEAELKSYKTTGTVPAYVKSHVPDKITNPELAYLEGELLDNYLNDLAVAQEYSTLNRKTILKNICKAMNWEILDEFESMHNYIDLEKGIIRKGATSAQDSERLIIPLNMRDGSIFATGKGNPDWNYSAPHGAGRVLSRSKAKEVLNMDDYKETMKDVYTSSVTESTLDEAPFAYKESQEIIGAISNTVNIDYIVKPVYNFKAK